MHRNSGYIHMGNGMDAQITYSSLENYLEKLEHNLRTKYDGDPRFCKEDQDFLDDAIDRTRILLRNLKGQHPNIVTKG